MSENKFIKYLLEDREEKQDMSVVPKIIDLFKKNPNPSDEKDIHALADNLKYNTHEFEEQIYFLLGSFLGYGRANEKNKTSKDVDQKELAMGIKVEMEHTSSKILSERIATDHLCEIPDYYTRLIKMEKEAGIKD
jgi:hypothetical protein